MPWHFFSFARDVRDSKLSAQQKLVLFALGLRSDPSGECYPSFDLLAEDTGLSRRTVSRVIPTLLLTAFVTRSSLRKRSNVYQLTSVTQTPDQCHTDTGQNPVPVSHRHQTSVTQTLVPVSHRHHIGVTQTPDLPIDLPIKGPSTTAPQDEEVKPKAKKEPRGSRLPDNWQLPKAWGLWAMKEEHLSEQQVRRAADRFRDHWLAATGRTARKVDWFATWRNWVRKDVDQARPGAGGNGRQLAIPEPVQPQRGGRTADEVYQAAKRARPNVGDVVLGEGGGVR